MDFTSIKKSLTSMILILVLAVTVGCGSSTSSNHHSSNGPLDPQGNWLFTLTGANSSLSFAGQLYELVPPNVTSNPMLAYGCPGSLNPHGSASGTDTINLTVTQSGTNNNAANFSLTGNIAQDQQSMSGTWTSTNTNGCIIDTNGTWTASSLAPVNGTYVGTTQSGIGITASLTENTDQTSAIMGQVTGTLTFTNSSCFTEAFTLPAWSKTGPASLHGGQTLVLSTAPDTNGVSVLGVSQNVDTSATSFGVAYSINGGVCNGQTFSVGMSRN